MDDIPVKIAGNQLTAVEYNNAPQESMNAVESAGGTLGGDKFQVSRAMAIYAATGTYYTDSGAANAYVLNIVSPRKGIIAYDVGTIVRFFPGNTNTTASTINVNSLGLKNIKDAAGNDIDAGEIEAGGSVELFYDGTNFVLSQSSTFTIPFSDAFPIIRNAADPTKLTGFDLSNVATGTRRDIVMPDREVNLTFSILQKVTVFDSAIDSGTTIIPLDDTIPQITEGDEYMTLAITPKRSDSKLLIEVQAAFNASISVMVVGALFRDATVDAVGAVVEPIRAINWNNTMVFSFEVNSTATSLTTFRFRMGPDNAATVRFNSQTAGRIFGGISNSHIKITEYIQ